MVCYINSSAAVKAESDVCCTSANAVGIVESLAADEIEGLANLQKQNSGSDQTPAGYSLSQFPDQLPSSLSAQFHDRPHSHG